MWKWRQITPRPVWRCEENKRFILYEPPHDKTNKRANRFSKGALGKTSVSTSIVITSYSLVVHVYRKKNVFQTIMLLLSDMPFIKHEACTKVTLHCTMPLFPITKITKMAKFLLLSHDHVCNIMCIKAIGMTRNCKASLCVSCWYSRKISVRTDSSEVIMTRHHA